ncbi:Cellobiose dehydrogenase cytochrome [Penicillium cf. griseofulvum]|uniref:Cellobiose dehydrogenase cytochrome n=1 Tax=Penicillium cf. griseofulvum TaxID=2972120 RepID=A0A9W9M1S0_9EURO|nr:Cellobiose dehydrogenase cytochrome [Penicillium cf. griseofulvum]KAJ5429133.1 Cellobiose dehydrogenase cytochrome [Penicillium cf. griseofulvum]KAJ5437074.1 Cellobiose dehydrogenase cytochrome [Penicillium cf. griseofulvum]
MRFFHTFAAVAAFMLFSSTSVAQSGTPMAYTDPDTGITFDTWTVSETLSKGGFTFGMALPSDALTTDATEFIGYLLCSSQNATFTGWCGVSLGGTMTNSLLLLAYPYDGDILTSFRYTSSYHMPDLYTGDAKLTQISAIINATHYSLIFRCSNCLQWTQGSANGNASTSNGLMNLGWVQSFPAPGNPGSPSNISLHYHDNGHNIWAATLKNAPNPSYTDWTKATVTGSSTKSGLTTTPTSSVPARASTTPK